MPLRCNAVQSQALASSQRHRSGYVDTLLRAALERQAQNEELELAETAVVVTPTYDN